MLLQGKKLLITGVLKDSSIAFHVAKLAQEEGAEIVLTSFGRAMKITQAIARRLPSTPTIIELDVTNQEHLDSLAQRLGEHVDRLDGVLHSIGYAPPGAFNFLEASWDDVATALPASAYSCCLTGSRRPRPRSSMSTVAFTRWVRPLKGSYGGGWCGFCRAGGNPAH